MKKILACVLAIVMASLCLLSGCNANGAYSDLSMMDGVKLGVEEYGIAFRKGSDMVSKVNTITEELFLDGTIADIAKKYDQTDSLVQNFTFDTSVTPSGESDYDYIKGKGKMVIGVTVYDPMNYYDENGKWIGFDTEYAEKVCAKLGVTPEFKVIVWGNKEMELQAKSIDCIWNGMTITDAIKNVADVTGAYINNYQVVVVKDAKTFTSLESLKGKIVVAEEGSAGELAAKADANLAENYKAVESQEDALLMVKSGQADACVIDYIMAKSMVG